MRTLKVLSLVLALVLCFGLVGTAFAAPANFEGYTDAAKIGDVYTEAADVLMGLGIIEGKTATTVDPTGVYTREQAAKVIAYMLVGKEAAEKLSASAAPFADVAANRWSAGFIAYCAEQGILSGVGNGNFNPTGTLTGYQFAKMLLAAIGYNANDEYEGASWSINVARDAIQKGIFEGDLAAATNAPITRQQAMLMAFNTLTAVPRVTYSELVKQYVAYNLGGWAVGAAVSPAYLIQNFGAVDAVPATDEFDASAVPTASGAAGHQWKIGAKPISDVYLDGTVAGTNAALATATEAALARAYSFGPGGAVLLVNGAAVSVEMTTPITPANTPLLAYDGASAQFIDSDKDGEVDEIVILEEYLAYVSNMTATTMTLQVFDSGLGLDTVPATDGTAINIALADYPANGLAKGDFVIITPDDANGGFATPISYKKAEPVTTKITEYATATDSVTYGGAKKIMAAQASLIPASLVGLAADFTADYNIFLNANGRPLGIALAGPAAVVVPNFMYVVDSQSAAANNSLLAQSAAQFKVKGVLMDGTVKTFDLQVTVNNAGVSQVNVDGAMTAVATSAAPLAAGTVYAYTLNDKGDLASVQAMAKNTAYLGYTPDWLNTAADAITMNAGNAVVTGLNSAGAQKYATTTTALVEQGKAVTTYTGYEKFPGTSTTAKTYTVGAGAGTCAAIVAIYKGNLITNILIVSQAATAPIVPPVVGIQTGNSVQKANAAGVDTTYVEFMKADGTTVEYPVANPGALAPGSVFKLTIAGGVATVEAANTAAGDVVKNQPVAEKTDTYIVIGPNVYYTTNVPVLDISLFAAGVLKPGTIAVGDNVTIVLDNAGNLTALFKE